MRPANLRVALKMWFANGSKLKKRDTLNETRRTYDTGRGTVEQKQELKQGGIANSETS